MRVGVSACLAGAKVRFDGGHEHDSRVELLGRFVELVSVCPEVERYLAQQAHLQPYPKELGATP
jgi:uncharacterized protein YbbK (DUF523 family)